MTFLYTLTGATRKQEEKKVFSFKAGLSSLGVPGVPWHTQILADQLTLFQPGGTDYAHLITTGTPGFSDLPTALELAEILEKSLTKKNIRFSGNFHVIKLVNI